MQETFEFRVVEDFADRVFEPDEGKKLGIVRLVKIASDDPRLAKIGDFQKAVHQETGGAFFHGWHISRKYTKAELGAAALLYLNKTPIFELAGEQCGTNYDESTACHKCGAGATQVSDLRLDLRKVPKGKDIARTIADEWIVSQRLAERMIDEKLTGFDLRVVRHKARYEDDSLNLLQVPIGQEILHKAKVAGAAHPAGKFWVWLNRAENRGLLEQARAENAALKKEKSQRHGESLPVWYQLVVTPPYAEIIAPTRLGINPFDDDARGECRCSLGDLIGLNLLSEVSISAASRGEEDIVCSRQFIGVRRGLLRPTRAVFISPKFWKLIELEKIKGVGVEIVHLV